MSRRRFLAAGGAISVAALGGAVPAAPAAGGGDQMRLDREQLAGRNRDRSTVVAMNGMVCTSQPLASLAGLEVLRAGGNAVDAAVAANAVLGVVEPMSCGLGGDLFAILWSEADRRLFGLNASGRAPYGWDLAAAAALGLAEIPAYSPLSWSVPGCVSGWAALLERFGSLPLGDLLLPAIRHARDGFPVSPVIARDWPVDAARFPDVARTFMPDGRAPRFGETFRNPDLAGTMERLAREGADAFYRGAIAERIAAYSATTGGRLAMRDLAEHAAEWVEPVSSAYRGWDVWQIPPNTQGIAVLQMLNLLEPFDIGALAPGSAELVHLFVEAKKLAFEDRARYYADMAFADVPVAWLISKEYAAERGRAISRDRAAQDVSAGTLPGGSDTIYLTTADGRGNMVSLIQSIFHGWGSRLVPEGLGFCLQNRGQLFALDPRHRNRLEPHKRPFHTIIPGFVTRQGRPVFAFGVMGGDFQPQGQVQVLMNLLDLGMSPQQAGDQARAQHLHSSAPTGAPRAGAGRVELERGFADDVAPALAAMGHAVATSSGAFGGYQGVWREESPRRYFGASDARKDGCAIGC